LNNVNYPVKLEMFSDHWVVTKRNSHYLSHLNCGPKFARFESSW